MGETGPFGKKSYFVAKVDKQGTKTAKDKIWTVNSVVSASLARIGTEIWLASTSADRAFLQDARKDFALSDAIRLADPCADGRMQEISLAGNEANQDELLLAGNVSCKPEQHSGFVVKVDKNAKVKHTKLIEDPQKHILVGRAVAVAKGQAIIVGGLQGKKNDSSFVPLVIKMNSELEEVWRFQFTDLESLTGEKGELHRARAHYALELPSGDILVTGHLSVFPDEYKRPISSQSFLLKLSSNGNLKWKRLLNDFVSGCRLVGLSKQKDGVIVVGGTHKTSTNKIKKTGILFSEFNLDGEKSWESLVPTEKSLYEAVLAENGDLVLTGHHNGKLWIARTTPKGEGL